MKNKISYLFLCIFLITGYLCGQDSLHCQSTFPSGITIEYGSGQYSVKDEYISQEKYSGVLPYYSINWVRAHRNYVYKLKMSYRNSSDIKNYNVSTDITQFTLNQGFLYSMGDVSLFQRKLFFWFGPSTEIFFFMNDQNIAVSGFDYAQSYFLMLSAGINVQGIYPISSDFQIESALELTALSLGVRMVDNEEEDESAGKLLTLLSGLNSSFDLGLRYIIIDPISLKLAYRFELLRVSAWDPLLSASDNLVFSLTYSF